MSVFVKKTTGTPTHYPAIQLDSARDYVILNTTTGAYNETGGTDNDSVEIEDWNSDCWRVIITNTLTSGSKRIAIWPALSSNGTSSSPTPTGSNVFYGIQLEEGSYPTSYIPTYGVSQTRLQDALVGTGAQSNGLLGTDSGTIFIDATHLATSNDTSSWSFANASNTQQFRVGSGASFFFISDRVHSQGDLIIYETTYKAAIRYSPSGLEVFVNGVKDTSSFANGDYTIDRLNYSGIGGRKMDFNQLLYFPTALSDEACIELTTI